MAITFMTSCCRLVFSGFQKTSQFDDFYMTDKAILSKLVSDPSTHNISETFVKLLQIAETKRIRICPRTIFQNNQPFDCKLFHD